MRPNSSWIKRNFQRFNFLCFGGKLPIPKFYVKNIGKKVLGECGFTNTVYYYTDDKEANLYVEIDGIERIIKKDNFDIAKPYIVLNSEYIGPKHMWIDILLHEMCHLAVYFECKGVKRNHGKLFHSFARLVINKMGGKIKIENIIGSGYSSHGCIKHSPN